METLKFNQLFGFAFGRQGGFTKDLNGETAILFQAGKVDTVLEQVRFNEGGGSYLGNLFNGPTLYRLWRYEDFGVEGAQPLYEKAESMVFHVSPVEGMPVVSTAGHPSFVRGAPPTPGNEFVGDFWLKSGDWFVLEITRPQGGPANRLRYEGMANWSTYETVELPSEPPVVRPEPAEPAELPEVLIINGWEYVLFGPAPEKE